MSSLTVEEEQKWAPTHVQVTVLRGRGLRGKGKHGTSDVYTIIQLGKEKYSTCVAEKTTEPEWREECSFELQPGELERGGGGGCPAGSNELVLTVMHRALIGMDVFLGQAVIQLDKVFSESRCVKNEWYRLNSKTGKKEKERGDIQVTVQFTRNNLTASMYDLVMKDKGFSTFTKLKERMRGKRRSSEDDSSSVVMPGGYGSLCRMRHRLPSDGGGEEDYEDDEGGEARRSKMRTFFLRGKLRKSSDTRSSTSLGSESSESSSRGGSLSPTAGISVVVSDLSNSPSNSSNLTADNSPEHTANTSPKSSLFKCDFGDEAGEITIAVPQPTVCVNGSHAYKVQPLDPGSGKPADSLGLGLLQRSLPLSMSLQNLHPHASLDPHKSPTGDGRRWSFDKPGEEEKAAIVAALEQSGPMRGEDEEEEEEEHLGQAAPSKAASAVGSESQGKKQRRNLFGRSESAGKGKSQSEDAPAATEEKHKAWFGSKESHSKPSLVVSPKLECSTDPFPPPLPTSNHPPGPPVDPASLVSPLHHTNPFCQPQTTPPPMSPCNPFFSVLQHNPFYEDMQTTEPLKPLFPPLPYLTSSRSPIGQLFPQSPNHALNPDNHPTIEESTIDAKNDPADKVKEEPLTPGPLQREEPLCWKLPNPFTSTRELEPDLEWDECFEAFAAGRLQSPEDLTADCKMQQNTPGDRPLENCNDKGTLLPGTDADQNTNSNDAQSCSNFLSVACETTSQVTNSNAFYPDTFANPLETIPEQFSSESEKMTVNTDSTNHVNSTSNDLTNTNMHHAPCHTSSIQLNSSSPDPGSSGLGSSAEEDFLSCLSSNSDKSSSSEEAEARNSESNILSFEKSSAFAVVKNSSPLTNEDQVSDQSNDQVLFDVVQKTVIWQQESDERVDCNDAPPHSPVLLNHLINTKTEAADTETLNASKVLHLDFLPKLSQLQSESNISSHPEDENGGNGRNSPIGDFSTELGDSSVSKDVKILANPDDEFPSTLPSFNILTSSPDVIHSSLDFGSGGQETHQFSPLPFGAFGDTGPAQDFDTTTLLHTRVSDQSSTSFLQSLYVSTDSQNYQTCESSKSSSESEPNETLHSVNSTLCGELSDIQTTALGLQDSITAAKSPIPQQTDRLEEFSCGVQNNTETPDTIFFIGNTCGLESLPAPLTDSEKTCSPSGEGVEKQHVVMDDGFLKSPESQSATLHRSQSEGTLTHDFHELLLPSFGSDPGAIQESSSALPGPALSCLTSFAPALTSSSSAVVALYSFPYPANALVRSPSSTARAAVPKPEEMQQQREEEEEEEEEEASQQNSPHPVKPLTTAILAEEKRTEGRSVLATGLEKLKSTINPGRSSQTSEQETPDRKKFRTEGAGSYYHLTHSELVALLVQREAELERQKVEYERQKVLLAKREVELKKLKPQIRDLEDYIDTLLVRIMEQTPTLLQVCSKVK